MGDRPLAGSFRDPAGFVFERDGVLLRRVRATFRPIYDQAVAEGLYARLFAGRNLVHHEEAGEEGGDLLLRPERVPFVSFPYEWCFGQLKEAALLTLRVHLQALEAGWTLKDASAYNAQFVAGRATLIDTLSFSPYREGEPWVAYGQFCRHFLAPLALMAYRDVRLGALSRLHIDGVPLDLAASLLPLRGRVRPGILMHLVLHAGFQRRYESREMAGRPAPRPRARPISREAQMRLVQSLAGTVERLRWSPPRSVWTEYESTWNYSSEATGHKRELVASFLDRLASGVVWDLGANVGSYSRLASERGRTTIAVDGDPGVVEYCWQEARRRQDRHLLPLVIDLANPSPSQGFGHEERPSLLDRGPAGAVMALALVHHLAIANNVPLPRVAGLLARCGREAIVEWVPKEDSQVQRMLASREDVFPDYVQEAFEHALEEQFTIEESAPVRDTQRTLYRLRRREES